MTIRLVKGAYWDSETAKAQSGRMARSRLATEGKHRRPL